MHEIGFSTLLVRSLPMIIFLITKGIYVLGATLTIAQGSTAQKSMLLISQGSLSLIAKGIMVRTAYSLEQYASHCLYIAINTPTLTKLGCQLFALPLYATFLRDPFPTEFNHVTTIRTRSTVLLLAAITHATPPSSLACHCEILQQLQHNKMPEQLGNIPQSVAGNNFHHQPSNVIRVWLQCMIIMQDTLFYHGDQIFIGRAKRKCQQNCARVPQLVFAIISQLFE